MPEYEVVQLEPVGLYSDSQSDSGSQFGVNVRVQPPFIPGEELGNFLSGNVGSILVAHVATKTDSTHLEIKTVPGREGDVTMIMTAIERLRAYLNADRSEMISLLHKLKDEPIVND